MRRVCLIALSALMPAIASAAEPAAAPAAAAAAPPTLCGRPADMFQLVLDMQKPAVVNLWRDSKIFVSRDASDGSIWGFAIRKTTAFPAAFCRRVVKDASGEKTETGQMCSANEKVCASFVAQVQDRFAKLDAKPAAEAGK